MSKELLDSSSNTFESKSQRISTIVRCSSTKARSRLPYRYAQELNVLPLDITEDDSPILTLAAGVGSDGELEKSLRFVTDAQIRLVEYKSEHLSEAIFSAYHSDDVKLSSAAEDLRSIESQVAGLSRSVVSGAAFRSSGAEPGRFLEELIDYAIARAASDIHLTPTSEGTWLRLRVQGVLNDRNEVICSLAVHLRLVQRIKVLSNLDTTESRLPQDGSFSVPLAERERRVRVSTMPTVYGEKVVLRLHEDTSDLSLEKLGLQQVAKSCLAESIKATEGLILLSGSTGSGKTTTLYSLLKCSVTAGKSIVSVEDPVESIISGVSQTEINEAAGLSFAKSLRAALRQDPDVIMIGEIRDAESAKVALQAALTGHLVLSTVHGRNVSDVFLRLESLGLNSSDVAAVLKAVVAQRLLPRLCDRCKVCDLQSSNVFGFEVFQAVGCRECDYDGHAGRILACEALDAVASKSVKQGRLDLNDLLQEGALYSFDMSFRDLLHSGYVSSKLLS